MIKPTEKMRDDYEVFLVEIDILLEDLNDMLANSKSYGHQRVKYDSKSLDVIEDFYLKTLNGEEEVPVSTARINRIIIAFYGEAVRERAGGMWEFCENDQDTAFGLPVIANWGEDVIAFSPVEVRDAQIHDRKPFIRDTVEYCENLEDFESKFFEEFD